MFHRFSCSSVTLEQSARANGKAGGLYNPALVLAPASCPLCVHESASTSALQSSRESESNLRAGLGKRGVFGGSWNTVASGKHFPDLLMALTHKMPCPLHRPCAPLSLYWLTIEKLLCFLRFIEDAWCILTLLLVGASNWHPARPHLKNMAVCAPLKTGTSTGSLCPSSNKPAASGFRNLSFSKKKGEKKMKKLPLQPPKFLHEMFSKYADDLRK